MRPDDLPLALSLFVKVGVPEGNGASGAALNGNSQVCFVTDNGRFAVHPNPDFCRLPFEVVQISGRDVSQVLLLRKSAAAGIYQLEVVGVQATDGGHIGIYK